MISIFKTAALNKGEDHRPFFWWCLVTTKACKTCMLNDYVTVWTARWLKTETSFSLNLESEETGLWVCSRTTALCVVICFVLFYFHLWVNKEGVKSFYFLLLRGMLRGARESVSLSNNPATSLPTRRILAMSREGVTEPFRIQAWLSQWNPHCYWKNGAGSYKSPSTSPEEAYLMHLVASGKHLSVFWYSIAKHSLHHSAML